MSSKKSKAKVSQADLRKMMQQMKSKKSEVSSNNAKQELNTNAYLKRKSSEQVYATVSKIHKSNNGMNKVSTSTVNIKSVQDRGSSFKKPSNSNGIKRPHKIENVKSEHEQPTKKLQKLNAKSNKPTTNPKSMPLIAAVYSDSSGSSDDDTPSTSLSAKSKNVKTEESSLESSLPAGFFDDPEVDAKMRGVETPADKMDREWESFQRELQRETGQSEQLIEEEHETGHIDREIDEIDEQIQFYQLVDKLCDKKDLVIHQKKDPFMVKQEQSMEVDSSSDENEDSLDWREKDAFT